MSAPATSCSDQGFLPAWGGRDFRAVRQAAGADAPVSMGIRTHGGAPLSTRANRPQCMTFENLSYSFLEKYPVRPCGRSPLVVTSSRYLPSRM